jgi:hypothetical protein
MSLLKMIIALIVFISVLFIYLHLLFHLKISDDLEIYEIDYPSKDKLEEVCDMRQPVLFSCDNQNLIRITNKPSLNYYFQSFEVKIRNTTDITLDDISSFSLPLQAVNKLFLHDVSQSYISEWNHDFILETNLYKDFQVNDAFFRPYMVSNMYYDILFGSPNSCTPLRYHVHYRNYVMVTNGCVKIKLTTPNSNQYLHVINDYNQFEFRSPINVWNRENNKRRFLSHYNKIKFIELTLTPGKVLFIPSYWWYSILFFTEDSSVSTLSYRTYMNNLAITPYYAMYLLQMQNTKFHIANTLNIDEFNAKLNKKKYDGSNESNESNE